MRCWVHAFWRLCASKKGCAALQIQRELDINYKSALLLLNRVRLAMAEWHPGDSPEKIGACGGTVEADETYVGGKPRPGSPIKAKRGRGTKKIPVFCVVERGGKVRMQVMGRLTAKTLGTDSVNHSEGEYQKKGTDIHSNTAESVFSLLKRGVYGTYHSISRKHLPRYLAEFEFRWNTRSMDDGSRTFQAIDRSVGKRLVYRG